MKKYTLALSLILGFTGLSNAKMLLEYEDDWLVVSSDVDLIGGINIVIGATGGTFISQDKVLPGEIIYRSIGAPERSPHWFLHSGPDIIALELPWDGGAGELLWGDPVLTPNPAGEWLRISFPGYTLGSETDFICQVDLLDQPTNEISSVYLIPEPASAAILLLGAAWMTARRKR